MLHLIASRFRHQRAEDGFTLIEILVVTMMIGIMAAIASPGMLGFLARSKVISANSELQGMFQEAQKSAIRDGKNCSLTMPESDTKSSDDAEGNLTISLSCLSTGDRNLKDVQIRHNLADINALAVASYAGSTSATINLFDFKGTTEDFLESDHFVLVVSNEDNEVFQKCLVISDGLGLVRAGNYPSNEPLVDVDKCTASN